YNQLLKYGLTPEEADAVVSQDWPALTEYGKSRLTELAAARWGLEPELVRALLDQDWDTAVNYAEVMVLEYLLNELMEAANAGRRVRSRSWRGRAAHRPGNLLWLRPLSPSPGTGARAMPATGSDCA